MKKNLSIIFASAAFGFTVPAVFIYLDLQEIGLPLTFENIGRIEASQRIHPFSLVAFPLLFALIGYLLRLNQLKLARLVEAHAQLLQASKMSALGEMAGGVAHEINTPLAIITTFSGQLKEYLVEMPLDLPLITDGVETIETTAFRIAKIVSGLRSFSRDGSNDPFLEVNVKHLVEGTLVFCNEKFHARSIGLSIDEIPSGLKIDCRETQISQVLLNLLNNSYDAIADLPEKWVKISVKDLPEKIEITVIDSGKGISKSVREKLFQPFYTTKEVGKGTGLGLSVSRGLIAGHRGELLVDTNSPNTSFVIRLPKVQLPGKANT